MNAGDEVTVSWMGDNVKATLDDRLSQREGTTDERVYWRVRIDGVPHRPIYGEFEMRPPGGGTDG